MITTTPPTPPLINPISKSLIGGLLLVVVVEELGSVVEVVVEFETCRGNGDNNPLVVGAIGFSAGADWISQHLQRNYNYRNLPFHPT